MMKIIIFKNDYLLISFISVNWLLSFFFVMIIIYTIVK